MNSCFLADEIEEESRKGKHPVRRAVLILGTFALLGGGVFAFAGSHDDGGGATDASTPVVATTDTPSPTPLATPMSTPTPHSDNVPQQNMAAPVSTAPSMAEVKAKLCKSVISGAQDAAKSFDAQFSDSLKGWISNFSGRFDSPEAEASKQWYKQYTQNAFAEYIKTNDPTMQIACESKTSLAGIMLQPNYAAWQ